MKQYTELSSIVQSVLVYKLSQVASIQQVIPSTPLQLRAILWRKIFEQYYESLHFWALGRYSHLLAPDQLLPLMQKTLEDILAHQDQAIQSQKLSFSYLTSHLKVLLDHYFQLSR